MTSRGTIVVVSPYRAEYGPPQTLEHVCRAAVGAGYQPICVVPPRARITPGLQQLEPTIHELDGLGTFPRTMNLIRLVRFFRRHTAVAREIHRIGVEASALAVYSTSEAIFAGGLAARRLGVPSIVHVIGMSIQSPRWGANIYIRLLARLADQFIASSSAVAEMLARFGIGDAAITVVHNGIDTRAIANAPAGPAPATGSAPRIGMIAAYDPRKGHELFVEASAVIARRHPDAQFFLIGGVLDGQPESLAFEQRVVELIAALGLEAAFVRPGFVPPPRVYDWIRAMDIVVVPSKTEAFAHALLEAMVCGKAVVATGIEGNLDAFVHGHSGVYVERDADAVGAAVCELLADPAKEERFGRAASERAQLFFDLGITIPALGGTIHRVIGTWHADADRLAHASVTA